MRRPLALRVIAATGCVAAAVVAMWSGPGVLVLLVAGVCVALFCFVWWRTPAGLTVAGVLVVGILTATNSYAPVSSVAVRVAVVVVLLTTSLLVAGVAESLPYDCTDAWSALRGTLASRVWTILLALAGAVAAGSIVWIVPVRGVLPIALGMVAAAIAVGLGRATGHR